jgi:hypothetical protein
MDEITARLERIEDRAREINRAIERIERTSDMGDAIKRLEDKLSYILSFCLYFFCFSIANLVWTPLSNQVGQTVTSIILGFFIVVAPTLLRMKL